MLCYWYIVRNVIIITLVLIRLVQGKLIQNFSFYKFEGKMGDFTNTVKRSHFAMTSHKSFYWCSRALDMRDWKCLCAQFWSYTEISLREVHKNCSKLLHQAKKLKFYGLQNFSQVELRADFEKITLVISFSSFSDTLIYWEYY